MVEMSTHFDPAAQLSKLSERLNHLEENLDEKSICLQQQRATLQGFNDDIFVLQTSEQNHLQACGEKIAALGTLQARMECILQRQRSISCGHHEGKAPQQSSTDCVEPGKLSAQRDDIESVDGIGTIREQAKAELKALQQKARSNKERLRQHILQCKQRKYHIRVLEAQHEDSKLSAESAKLFVSMAESVRGRCHDLHQTIVSQQHSRQQIQRTVDILALSLQVLQQQCQDLKAEELTKAAELHEIKRAVSALSPLPAATGTHTPPSTPRQQNSAPLRALARDRPDDCIAAGCGIVHGGRIGIHCVGNTQAVHTKAAAVEPIPECEFYVEEPESPEMDTEATRAYRPRMPIVQTSPVTTRNGSDFVSKPFTGAGHVSLPAHVVMRTVERKPLKQGMTGTTQLRLKEVYQTIDSAGNSRSQYKTRFMHGGSISDVRMCLDTRRSAVDHRQDQSSAVSRLQSQIQNGHRNCSMYKEVGNAGGMQGNATHDWHGHEIQYGKSIAPSNPYSPINLPQSCGVHMIPGLNHCSMRPVPSTGPHRNWVGTRLESEPGSAPAVHGDNYVCQSTQSASEVKHIRHGAACIPASNIAAGQDLTIDHSLSKANASAAGLAVSASPAGVEVTSVASDRPSSMTRPAQKAMTRQVGHSRSHRAPNKRNIDLISTTDLTSKKGGRKPKHGSRHVPQVDVFGGRI